MTMNTSKGLVSLAVAALLIGGSNSYQFPSTAKKSPVGVNDNNQPSNIVSSQKDLRVGPSSSSAAADNTMSMRLSRRNLLRAAAALSVGTLTAQTATPMKEAAAAEGTGDDVATPLYFGVGVSHFVQACSLFTPGRRPCRTALLTHRAFNSSLTPAGVSAFGISNTSLSKAKRSFWVEIHINSLPQRDMPVESPLTRRAEFAITTSKASQTMAN